MSEKQKSEHQNHAAPTRKKEMTRRQFLSYTLGGTGGFMAGLTIIPMLRFAVDPILQTKGAGDFVKVCKVSDVTDTPQVFNFKKHQVDGWYESDVSFGAFIAKDKQGDIYALSDICTHLGCTIPGFGTDPATPDQFACPCHGSHFDKYGKNLVVAPTPLNQYQVKIQGGYVYLGAIQPNTEVKKEE